MFSTNDRGGKVILSGLFLGLALCIGYLILTVGLVAAATLYSQTNSTDSTTFSGGTVISGGEYPEGQLLGNGLVGTVSTTTIYLEASGGLSNPTYGVRLQCYTDAGYTSFSVGCSSSNDTQVVVRNGGKQTFDFSTALSLDPTKYYKLGVGCNSGCPGGTNPNLKVWGTNSDLYAGGDFTTGLTDLYFTLDGAAVDTIVFTNPEDEEILPHDFTNWTFSYTLANPTSSDDLYYGLDIFYTASSTSISYFEVVDSFIKAEGQGSGSISTFKDLLLAPDTYTATSTFYSVDLTDCEQDLEAGIYCDSFLQFASTTLAIDNITFETQGFASYFDDINNSTSTISNLNATCDASSNFFSQSLCKMFITLFIPSQESLSQFDGIADLITKKPPVGYFGQIKLAFESFATSTLASEEFSFSTFIGDFAPISALRTGLGWLFWLLFAFWIFHRLRHLDFHS